MSRRTGPGGGLPNHDHSGAGRGGGTLNTETTSADVVTAEEAFVAAASGITDAFQTGFVPEEAVIPQRQTSSFTLNDAVGVFGLGEYVYTISNDEQTFEVVDVSAPSAPVQAGTTSMSGPRVVFGKGNYAYILDTAEPGLIVMNVSNPAAPTRVGSVSTPELDLPTDVFVSGDYAYIATGVGLVVVDVSDPTAPTEAGTLSISDVIASDDTVGIHKRGDYAYLSTGRPLVLRAIDVSDPTAPTEVGSAETSITFPGTRHSVFVRGNFAYCCGGIPGAPLGRGRISWIDISNPEELTEEGFLNLGNGLLNAIVVRGNYAYAGGEVGRVFVVNVADSANISQVGSINIGGTIRDISVRGNFAYAANENSVVTIGGTDTLKSPTYEKLYFDNQQTSIRFDPDSGANGALVVRDESNNEDRLYIPLNDAVQVANHGFDLNDQNLVDGEHTVYNSSEQGIVRTDLQVNQAVEPRGVALRHRAEPGAGTVTETLTAVEFREPGNANDSEGAVLDRKVFIDPSVPGAVRFHLANIVADSSSTAALVFAWGDSFASSTDALPANEGFSAQIGGNGILQSVTITGAVPSTSSDSSQDNAWVNALNWVQLSWDGSELTVTATDGTTEVSSSEGANYPSGLLPVNRIAALDDNLLEAENVDFDVTRIEVRK